MRQPLRLFCGVYAIIHVPSGKQYVGCAADIATRWYFHRIDLKKGRHYNAGLQGAWNTDGVTAFTVDVLEECLEQDLLEREQFWITELGVRNSAIGFNLQWRGGDWADPAYKAMMSAAAKKRAGTRKGRAQVKAARANRKDYSTFGAYARSCVKNPRNGFRAWAPEEDTMLRESLASLGAKACAEKLNRSTASVYVRASKLDISARGSESARERQRIAALDREAKKREAKDDA